MSLTIINLQMTTYTHQPVTPPIVICFATDSFERSAKKRRTAALFEFCLWGNIPKISHRSSEHILQRNKMHSRTTNRRHHVA